MNNSHEDLNNLFKKNSNGTGEIIADLVQKQTLANEQIEFDTIWARISLVGEEFLDNAKPGDKKLIKSGLYSSLVQLLPEDIYKITIMYEGVEIKSNIYFDKSSAKAGLVL